MKILFTNQEDLVISQMIYWTICFQNQEGCQICIPGLVYIPWKSGSLLQNQEGLAALLYEEANIFKLHILV